MKYYIQNGNTKLVKDVQNLDEAGTCMARYLMSNHLPIDLFTMISKAGFPDDLMAAKMSGIFDDGYILLTSSAFDLLGEDEMYIALSEKETEVLKTDTPESEVLNDLIREYYARKSKEPEEFAEFEENRMN